ncbi:hypothetical protein ES705_24542 [subsurface metagenome]
MKRNTLLLVLFIGTFLFTNCNRDEKYTELIIGKYYRIEYVEDIEWDADVSVSMACESFEEFFPNKISIEEGIFKFSTYNETSNNRIVIEYTSGPDTSRWGILNSYLWSNLFVNITEYQFNFKSSNARTYSDKEVVKYLREIIETNMVDAMKQILFEEQGIRQNKIIELNENCLITRDYDGELIIRKRIN